MKLAKITSLAFWMLLPTVFAAPSEEQDGILHHPRKLGSRRHRQHRRTSGRIAECHGDCDSYYRDCESHLACWFRDPTGGSRQLGKGKGGKGFRNLNFPRDEVPGCPTVTPPDAYTDYCVDPDKFPSNTLWYVGDNHKPRSVFPLKRCWGDCDNDHDCEDGLVCLQRDAHSPTTVPGCAGDAFVGVDYCIEPQPTPRPTPHPTPSPTKSPKHLAFQGHCNKYDNVSGRTEGCKHFPLEQCEGDCDSDHDCQDHLICWIRDDRHPDAAIPGCRGHPVDDETDYCIDPDDV